jgi:hypothetical protein
VIQLVCEPEDVRKTTGGRVFSRTHVAAILFALGGYGAGRLRQVLSRRQAGECSPYHLRTRRGEVIWPTRAGSPRTS